MKGLINMEKSKLLVMAQKIAKDEDETSFREFMESMTCSGEIYEKKYGSLLDVAMTEEVTDEDLEEVIVPFVTALLFESQLKDKPVFSELMKAIRMSYFNFTAWREEKEFIIDASKNTEQEIRLIFDTIKAMTNSGHWRIKEQENSKVDTGYVKYVLIRVKQP